MKRPNNVTGMLVDSVLLGYVAWAAASGHGLQLTIGFWTLVARLLKMHREHAQAQADVDRAVEVADKWKQICNKLQANQQPMAEVISRAADIVTTRYERAMERSAN